ncbi:ComEA family DNA-binding protein [Rhodoferax sp.]|uniref:ComEA family DNA-binding protein n=1 Tax=Rhodoferax sp. TaxID=50421 RepID=UPI00374D271D
MQHHIVQSVLIAAAMLFSANASLAADTKAKAAPAVAVVKSVDINSAKKSDLEKLPGVTDAHADRIIAGRPYGSKAQLVTRNIIDTAVYLNLKDKVIAKQPYKDAAKNAALYEKPKASK